MSADPALLMTLTVNVGVSETLDLGHTVEGRRTLVPILGGRFEGERLGGRVRPAGFDWAVELPDGSRRIDVRTLLETDDGALVHLEYEGRFRADERATADLEAGRAVAEDDYSVEVACRFACGDPRYAWLDDARGVARGRFGDAGLVYAVFRA